MRQDWLPEIYAAHCITSYPVGLLCPYPHSACLRRGSQRMGPIYETAVLLAQGWHGHHPSRADRGKRCGAAALIDVYALTTAPSGRSPVVRLRHSATISLRAKATMAMRLMRLL